MAGVKNLDRRWLVTGLQDRFIKAGIPTQSRRLAVLAWVLQWLIPLLWVVIAYIATTTGTPDLDGGPANSIDLKPISKISWIVLSSIAPIFLGLAFRRMYVLLRTFGQGQFFTKDTADAMRGVGVFILLYVVFWQIDVLVIGTIMYYSENLRSFPWVLNFELGTFAAGLAVLLLAGVIKEGCRMQEELRFVV